MEVARALSSQKPCESASNLSFSILDSLLATSKKPPQDQHTVSHILQIFYCHNCKIKVFFLSDKRMQQFLKTNFKFKSILYHNTETIFYAQSKNIFLLHWLFIKA